VFSVFGDTFLKSAKVKKPDDRFISMKESVEKLQDNLDVVERLYSRIGKRQQGKSIGGIRGEGGGGGRNMTDIIKNRVGTRLP
jgi:hypothetical protein